MTKKRKLISSLEIYKLRDFLARQYPEILDEYEFQQTKEEEEDNIIFT